MIAVIPPANRPPDESKRKNARRRPVRIFRRNYWYYDIPANRRDRRDRFLTTRRSRRQLDRELRETVYILRIAMPLIIMAIILISTLTDRKALTLLAVTLLLSFTVLPRVEQWMPRLYERRKVEKDRGKTREKQRVFPL